MLQVVKMKKAKQLLSTTRMETRITMPTKDGRLSILIKLEPSELRDSTRNSVSISIDHSILDQDFHSRELLNATVPTMSGSRDGERMLLLNNGTSMRSQRPSRTTTGRATHSISNPMVDQPMSDAQLPTQDGGKCSDTKVLQSSMKEERSWKFKETLIKRTETSVSTSNKMDSGNNGTLSMLTNGRENQEKESSMKTSV
jgi:hypothetical protein